MGNRAAQISIHWKHCYMMPLSCNSSHLLLILIIVVETISDLEQVLTEAEYSENRQNCTKDNTYKCWQIHIRNKFKSGMKMRRLNSLDKNHTLASWEIIRQGSRGFTYQWCSARQRVSYITLKITLSIVIHRAVSATIRCQLVSKRSNGTSDD